MTDGLETLAASLSPSMVADAFGFSPKDYSKMELSDKKHAMKEATSKLASKLVTSFFHFISFDSKDIKYGSNVIIDAAKLQRTINKEHLA